jgi:hypothetical protein
MTRAIHGLLSRAADAALSNDGVVPADIAMKLAAEGYDLDSLDLDIERILSARGQ